jgi:hypothetical protein
LILVGAAPPTPLVRLTKAKAHQMTSQRIGTLWAGWGGTALFLACWVMISRISAFSVTLWVALMSLGGVIWFYGGLRRSKWFLIPAFAAVLVMSGVVAAVYRGG